MSREDCKAHGTSTLAQRACTCNYFEVDRDWLKRSLLEHGLGLGHQAGKLAIMTTEELRLQSLHVLRTQLDLNIQERSKLEQDIAKLEQDMTDGGAP